MNTAPAAWTHVHADQRQRAPFVHSPSSLNLAASNIAQQQARPLPVQLSTWIHDDKLDSASSRSSSPAPDPFRAPTFSIPSIDTIRFVALCSLWYASSAVSSNTGKVILNRFRYPVTLTIVQFFFVALYCIILSRLGWSKLRYPTRAILQGVLPMASFQVGGHIFGSLAISRVPVSTVHTIKVSGHIFGSGTELNVQALSPLFTVLAYAFLFGVSYSPATYLSLLPLTLGVMLACSFDLTISNIFGLICAFGSTLIFVSQNIFFKRIMPTNSDTTGLGAKLDKINLLYFSSSMAFFLMVPVWIYSDLPRLLVPQPAGPSVALYFFINGTVHFAQNLLAFAILSSTSPVTYSIASLVKRIAVICLAIFWFKQAVHPVQAVGIGLTGVGLWMYNNAKRDVEKGEKKMRQVEAVREGLLPTTKSEARIYEGKVHGSPKPMYQDYSSASKSSALRGFEPPTTIYPSPPASASSSPPLEKANGPTRHRRMSEARDETYKGNAPAPRQQPTIQESSIDLTT